MTELTDPALAHWMDEHRRHACALVHQMIGMLYDLPEHDRHAMDAAAAERVALGQAAVEVARHLESVELHGTALWLRYLGLGSGVPAEVELWRETYASRGADGLRAMVLPDLEQIAAELEHPPAPPPDREIDEWMVWSPPGAHALKEGFGHAWETAEQLAHHPHDPTALAAVQQAWAALAEVARAATHHLAGVATRDDLPSIRLKNQRLPPWFLLANSAYGEICTLLDAPGAEQALRHGPAQVLHDTLHHVAYYVNQIDELFR